MELRQVNDLAQVLLLRILTVMAYLTSLLVPPDGILLS
jgi:hypothetical protein